jgi:beta-glucosidase-like glycosyl hydrolase|tara:strand:+ start:5977 stop:7356 length:1380 start_codon:yes stop_codon:yes gene_type:complete
VTNSPTDWLVAPALRLDQGEGLAEALRCLREFDPRFFLIFGGDAEDVAWLHETLEEEAGHPIVFAGDLERGAGQQYEGLTPLPDAWALGQLGPEACYDAGHRTATEAAQAHVRWIFGPVLDLHRLAPETICSPIIANRAFGEEAMRIIECAGSWIKGVHDGGGFACGKHFPGHGACPQDSHVENAVSFEDPEPHLVPFRTLAKHLPSMMTGHIEFPMLDEEMRCTSRSPIIMDILRKDMGYNGVVVTDSLRMAGFGDGPHEELAAEAIHAGCDLLLDPEDPVVLATSLRDAMDRGDLLPDAVERSVKRLESFMADILNTEAEAPRPLVMGASAKRLLHPLHGGSPGRTKFPQPETVLSLAGTPDSIRFLEDWGLEVLPADSTPPDEFPGAVLVLCGAREGHGLPQLPGPWLDAISRDHPVTYVAGAPEAIDLPPASVKGFHLPGLSPALLALLFAAGEE